MSDWIKIENQMPKHRQKVFILLNNCNIFDSNGERELKQIVIYQDGFEVYNEMPDEPGILYDLDMNEYPYAWKGSWKSKEHYIELNGPRHRFGDYTIKKETCWKDYVIAWKPFDI